MPIGKVPPDAWSHVIVGVGSIASFAVTVKGTATPAPEVASFVIGPAGTVRFGGVLSWTVTSKPAAPEVLPASSLAVQET